jgi:hypothetical protein
VLSITHVSALPEASAKELVDTNPHTRNPTAITEVTPKTTQSTPRLPVYAFSSMGTSSAG